MSGEFTVTLSYDDYLGANWLRVRHRWWWKGAARFVGYTTVLYSAIFALGEIPHRGISFTSLMAITAMGLIWSVLVLAAIVVYWLWSVPRQARKIWAEQPLMKLQGRYNFDASGFRNTTERESYDLLWSHIRGWLENERLIVMGKSRMTFFIIPKSQLDPAMVEAFKDCLRASGVKNGI